jgi:dihydrofolate reductase
VSTTLKKAEWTNSYILSSNIVDEVKKLKEQEGGDIDVHGSGQLARFLLEYKLVDQLNLLVYPVILGEGKKLFEGALKTELKLIESETFATGVVKLIYHPK